MKSYTLIVANRKDLDRLVEELLYAPRVAVDTESDSLYSYYHKVCLIQLSVPGKDIIVDPLAMDDLSPLGRVMASPDVEKVFHAATNDILALKHDYDFRFSNLFDTYIAARMLEMERQSLAYLLKTLLGVSVNKKYQKANWGQRPLPRELMEYATNDTRYLLKLRDRLEKELRREGLWAEAKRAFARLERIEPEPKQFDPRGYRRIHGARSLSGAQLSVLEELYRFREREAQKLDRPPFKVLSNEGMLNISKTLPKNMRDLEKLPGVGAWHRRRFGKAILRLVHKALGDGNGKGDNR